MGKSVRNTGNIFMDEFGEENPKAKATTNGKKTTTPVEEKASGGNLFVETFGVEKKSPSETTVEPSSTGTKPTVPSQSASVSAVVETPTSKQERYDNVAALNAQDLLTNYQNKAKEKSLEVITNPFGSGRQYKDFAQSREGKTGLIVSDIIEKGEFRPEDINYLAKAAPAAAKQLVQAIVKDADQENLLSEENLQKLATEGKSLVDAEMTERKVKKNQELNANVKNTLAKINIDPTRLEDPAYVATISQKNQADKSKELAELDKKYPTRTVGRGLGIYDQVRVDAPGYNKEKALIEAKYSNVQNALGLTRAMDFAVKNPTLTPKEIGAEYLKYNDPDAYKLWEKAGKKGAIDRDLAEIGTMALYASGNQGAIELAKKDEVGLDDLYPDKLTAEVMHRLGAEYYKDSNPIFNAAPGVEQLDKYAEQLPQKLKDHYYKHIRENERRNVGTEVPVSGLINKVGEGAFSTANETWKGLGDLVGARSEKDQSVDALNEGTNTRLQDVGTYAPAVQRLKEINAKQKEGAKLSPQEIEEKQDLETFTGVRSTAQEIIDGTGNLTGQVLFQALGTKGLGAVAGAGLKGAGLMKATQVLNGVATEEAIASSAVNFGISKAAITEISAAAVAFASSYDGAKRDALRLMPQDKDSGKRTLYATIVGGLNAGTERIFKDEKVLGAFNKEISPNIKTLVGKLTAGTLSKEAFAPAISQVLLKSKAFLGEALKANTKEATEELATSVGQSIATSILAPTKFNEKQAYDDAISTFTTTFLHGGLVSGLASVQAYKANNIGIPTLSKIGIDEKLTEDTKGFINAQLLSNNMTQEEANGKFKILNTAAKINREVMPQVQKISPLPQKAAEKYSVQLLNENILKENAKQAKDDGDTVLEEKYNTQIKESEKIRKDILDKKLFVDDNYTVKTEDEINAEQVAQESGVINAQEQVQVDEASKLVTEMANEGLIPDTYAKMAKEDPQQFLKEVYQQANNVDEQGNPLEGDAAQATKDQFTETLVETANEVFPIIQKLSKLKSNEKISSQESSSQESGQGGSQESSSQKESDVEIVSESEVIPPNQDGAGNAAPIDPKEQIRQRYIDDFNIVEDSKFDWRVTSELSTSDRKKAVQDIKDGKNTAAARKLQSEIDEMMDRGTVIINRGRGNQAETVEIPVNEWFGLDPKEQDAALNMDDFAATIIRDNDINANNIDDLKNLFDGFPYEQSDFQAVKDYLAREGTVNDKSKPVGEEVKTETATKPAKEVKPTTSTKKPNRKALSDELRTLLGNDASALNREGDTNPQNRVSFQDLGIVVGDTLTDVIDKLIAYGGEFTQILEAIKADPNFNNIRLELVDSRRGLENAESGLYHPVGHGEGKDGLLQVANKDNVYYTVAHEMMHFFTLDSKAAEDVKNDVGYKSLEDMYNYIAAKKGKPVAGQATVESYGLTNVKEFMAELLINPTFRKYVGDVFAENQEDILKASKNLRDRKAKSIGDVIFNLFRDLFDKLFSGNKQIPLDERQSVVDNAARLATQLFFGGQDVTVGQTNTAEGAKVVGMGNPNMKAAALANPGIRNDNQNSDVKGPLVKSKEAKKIIDYLSKKYGIEGVFKDLGILGSLGQFNRNAIKVEINSTSTLDSSGNFTAKRGDNFNRRTIFHEYIHPFVEILGKKNRALYDNILDEAKKTNASEKFADIDHYPKSQQDEELIVRYLDRLSDLDKPPTILQRFLNWVSDILFSGRKNKSAKLESLSTNTTVEQLYDVFKNYGNIKSDFIEATSKPKTIIGKLEAEVKEYEDLIESGLLDDKGVKYINDVILPDLKNKLDAVKSEEIVSDIPKNNKVISDFIKSSFERGAFAEDIQGALVDNGFTEEEAKKLVDDNTPPSKPKSKDTDEGEFENKPKSILKNILGSSKIPKYVKDRFESEGLRYNPQSHSVAREMAKDIIDEFGVENSIEMAESGRFDGDVNSMIFAEGIDRTFEKEQKATTPEGKQRLAEQWADYVLRYDEAARQKGKFISAIYDFYKKSPLGVVMAERTRRDETFAQWYKGKENAFKEIFEEIKGEPQFQEYVKSQVQSTLKEERQTTRKVRRKKIEDIFDSAKIKGGTLNSSIIPPQIWNGAMEVMKQAALAGEALVDVIEAGISHIKSKHGEAFDEDRVREDWKEKFKGIDTTGKAPADSETIKKRILDRFRRRLSGLTDSQKEDVIRRSFKTLVENGALEYNEFKKIVADVMGLGDLPPEQVQKINEYVKDINGVQDAADKALETRSKKSIEDFETATKKAEKAATKLGEIVNSKTDLVQRVRSIIQLNTLGFVSLIKNPFYNIAYQALVRFPKAVIQTGIDQAIYGTTLLANKVIGTPIVKPDVNIFLSQKGYFKKAGTGTKESVGQVFTGLTNMDYFAKEIRSSQIKPLQSWKDIWAWKKGEKFLSGKEVADRVIQGTVGIPAEVVARMLNIGDKPFRFAAEGAVAETVAQQEFNLKGIDKELFIRFPKEEATRLYKARGMEHDQAVKKAEAIEKRIVAEGEQAVFQQKNLIMEGLNGLGAMMGNFAEDKPIPKTALTIGKVIGTLNAPFIKTPLNIFWDLFNLAVPEVALAQSAIYGYLAAQNKYNGDSAKASEYLLQSKKWAAHAGTGYALMQMLGYFASIGAISGSDDEDKGKERKGKKLYARPKSLNVSKITRAFTNGNVEDEDNDLFVDLSWFGSPGVIMNMQANRYENMTPEERKNGDAVGGVLERMNASAVDGLENSIFQGTIAGLNAFKQGGRWVNTWALNQINVGSNFFQPATLAQFSRATLPYNPSIKADTFSEELKNNFASRSLLVRAFAGYPPSDITVWGDPSMRNNTGAKGVAFNMLGFDEYNKDVFAEPIYQDFKKTGNSSFFPPDVKGTMTVDGQTMKMSVEQERQFKTLVGQSRKSLVAPFINEAAVFESKDETLNDKRYNEMSDAEKVKALNILYKKGYDGGKEQFKLLYSEYQTQKEKAKLEEENENN